MTEALFCPFLVYAVRAPHPLWAPLRLIVDLLDEPSTGGFEGAACKTVPVATVPVTSFPVTSVPVTSFPTANLGEPSVRRIVKHQPSAPPCNMSERRGLIAARSK
jgi:hypothetical protein